MSGVQINGFVADGFERVRDAFLANFTEHGDVGAGFAAVRRRRPEGGPHRRRGRPRHRRAVHRGHAAAGLLDHQGRRGRVRPHPRRPRRCSTSTPRSPPTGPSSARPASRTCPVRWLLSHRVGLPVVDDPPSLEEVLRVGPDRRGLAAARHPCGSPAPQHGYHALTYGWLVGEIVRRVSGQSHRARSSPRTSPARSGSTSGSGCPPRSRHRVSPDDRHGARRGRHARPQQAAAGDPGAPRRHGQRRHEPRLADEPGAAASTGSSASRAGCRGTPTRCGRPRSPPPTASPTRGPSPSMYAATIGEVDGVRLLSDEAVKRACEEQSNGRDECLIVDTRFGLGFFLPSTFSPLVGSDVVRARGRRRLARHGRPRARHRLRLRDEQDEPRPQRRPAHGRPSSRPPRPASSRSPGSSPRPRRGGPGSARAGGARPGAGPAGRGAAGDGHAGGEEGDRGLARARGGPRTRSARRRPPSSDSRTRAPTMAWASRNGMPCSTRCSARSVADDVGRVGGRLHAVDVELERGEQPGDGAEGERAPGRPRRTAAPCPPAGRGCTRAGGPSAWRGSR